MANNIIAAPLSTTNPTANANLPITGTDLEIDGVKKRALDVNLAGATVQLKLTVEGPDSEVRQAPATAVDVPPDQETIIMDIEVPANTRLFLTMIESSIDAVGAEIRVYLPTSPVAHLKRSWWKDFNLSFPFAQDQYGIPFNAGQHIIVTAFHQRDFTARANTRMLGAIKSVL